MAIHDLFFSVTQITTSNPKSSSTGFFCVLDDGLYLITNRHCVLKEPDFVPQRITILLHRDPSELTSIELRDIELYNADNSRRWLEHPEYGAYVDVVAIPLDAEIGGKYCVKAVSEDLIIRTDLTLAPGEDLMVFGFPLGFFDSSNFLPVVRTGTLATAHNVPYQHTPSFLVDSRLHEGSSGSPVWTKPTEVLAPKGQLLIGTKPGGHFFLTGVFSATLDKTDSSPKHEPLALHKVWFASLIPEIIRNRE